MRALLLFFSLFSLTMFVSFPIKESPKNVTIILHLDQNMTNEEQEVYLWSFCDWISGSERNMWDSVFIKKGQREVVLQGFVPYQNTLSIRFTKNGPMELDIYACPNDTIELNVSTKDKNVKWKYAEKGEYHNLYTKFSKEERSYWVKIREAVKDSITFYQHFLMEFYIKNLHESFDPQLSKYSWSMIQMFFKDSISKDSIQILRQYVAQKFPEYPPAALTYGNATAPTERTKLTKQRLNDISVKRSFYEKGKQSTQMGNRIYLNLSSLNGERISTTDLKSNYIFVDIWASWCKPCREQIPYLKSVLAKYKQEVKIYAVSIDANHDAWRKAVEKDHTQDFIHVIGTDEERRKVQAVEILGVERIPRNFLLDSNCRIIARDLLDNQLMQKLDSLLKQ